MGCRRRQDGPLQPTQHLRQSGGTDVSVTYMMYTGVFDRFPNLKLALLHGGGYVPYHLGRLDQGKTAGSGSSAIPANYPPSKYLKNLYFDNLVYRVETVEYLKRMVGADHTWSAPTIPSISATGWPRKNPADELHDAQKRGHAAWKRAKITENPRKPKSVEVEFYPFSFSTDCILRLHTSASQETFKRLVLV